MKTINDFVGIKLDTENKRNEFVSFIRENYLNLKGVVGSQTISGFFQDNLQDEKFQYVLYSNEFDVEYEKDTYWMLGKVSFDKVKSEEEEIETEFDMLLAVFSYFNVEKEIMERIEQFKAEHEGFDAFPTEMYDKVMIKLNRTAGSE